MKQARLPCLLIGSAGRNPSGVHRKARRDPPDHEDGHRRARVSNGPSSGRLWVAKTPSGVNCWPFHDSVRASARCGRCSAPPVVAAGGLPPRPDSGLRSHRGRTSPRVRVRPVPAPRGRPLKGLVPLPFPTASAFRPPRPAHLNIPASQSIIRLSTTTRSATSNDL